MWIIVTVVDDLYRSSQITEPAVPVEEILVGFLM